MFYTSNFERGGGCPVNLKWVGTAKASTPDVKSLGSRVIKSDSDDLVGVGPNPPVFKFPESPSCSSDSLSDTSLSVVKVEKKGGECSITLKAVKTDVLPTKPYSTSALNVLVPKSLAGNMVANESMNVVQFQGELWESPVLEKGS